ncbi:BTAD domain-containing putative transcriptional regulator [Aestuariivirga litoralis]|uniref:BTAD domain-containing putative transcriptional regulator n=1 Tax=Aestuariivirga litoralis TaxID=2650924 RepID=UPI0013796060|nr:BTAD domain-containing putative transcriptional regulator [Aestuariivirga litoralis]
MLRLLGPFQLIDPQGHQIEFASKKNRLLLAMLACAPRRSMSREALAGLLWAEHGEEQARNSLRQALAVLRKELGGQDAHFFAATDATIALHPTLVRLDTDAFLSELRGTTRPSLEAALALWRGPFLADVRTSEPELEDWLHLRRESYQGKYVAGLDRLVPMLSGQARIEMAQRLVQADPLREASHRQLMEAYLAEAERPLALRHYDKLRKLLHDELGVEPSPETRALRDRIAATGKTTPSAPAPAAAPAPTVVSAPVDVAEPPSPRAAHRGRGAMAAIALLLVAVAAAGAAWHFTRPPPAPAGPPAVAVLPFESLSSDAADLRLAEGLTLDTIADLSRYSDFRVMANDTTEAYKGKPVDIRALGRDLKVSHVLKGTFERDKDHIRVTAQLIDAETGAALWSDRYDRMIGEIFAVQGDVADHIANSLAGREGKVSKSLAVGARRKPPADLGAYDLYLLAQETMYSDLSPEHMREAQNILDQAIAKDANFARAYVRYANTFAWLATTETGAAELFQQMLRYARKAVALDPMDADAHAALGYALTMTGDYEQGQVQLEEALRLTPNAFDILIFQSCLAPTPEKEMAAADRAIALNPAFPKWAVPCLRLAYVLSGRYADAIKVQSRQPEAEWNTDGFVVVAGSLATLGQKDEAAAVVKRGVAKFPGLLSIERFALNRGWPPDAINTVEDLMRRAGFPACATSQELSDTPNPVRLPECTG